MIQEHVYTCWRGAGCCTDESTLRKIMYLQYHMYIRVYIHQVPWHMDMDTWIQVMAFIIRYVVPGIYDAQYEVYIFVPSMQNAVARGRDTVWYIFDIRMYIRTGNRAYWQSIRAHFEVDVVRVLSAFSSRYDIMRKYYITPKYGFQPKPGKPCHFGAKKRYILKSSTNHTPGALRLASLTSYLFLG